MYKHRQKLSASTDSEPLGPVLGFMRALWELDHALASVSKRMRGRLGVTGPERLVLRVVGQIPDISPGEVAEFLHVDPSSLTGLLKRLIHRKLITRQVDVEDARRSLLRLTPEGDALNRVRAGTVEAGVHAALDTLAPRDVATAVIVLGALSRALKGVSAKGGPRYVQKTRGRARRRPERSLQQR